MFEIEACPDFELLGSTIAHVLTALHRNIVFYRDVMVAHMYYDVDCGVYRKVTVGLDWQDARYGDELFDVAVMVSWPTGFDLSEMSK